MMAHPKVRLRQPVRERDPELMRDVLQPLLCLLMARNQIITEAVGFGSSRSPLGNPAHILLLDLNLDGHARTGAAPSIVAVSIGMTRRSNCAPHTRHGRTMSRSIALSHPVHYLRRPMTERPS